MKIKIMLFSFTLLAGASYGQAIPGGDMENWKSYSVLATPLQRPDQWTTSDSVIKMYVLTATASMAYTPQITKESTLIHDGAAAAKIETRHHTGTTDTFPGAISNGKFKISLPTLDYSFSGGMPVSSRVAGANAWVRYTPAATSDSAALYVMALKAGAGSGGADSVVGEGMLLIGANSSFSKVSAPIVYKDASVVPDHIVVVLFSSWADPVLPGSVLYADDVTISPTSGVEIPVFNSDKIKAYPNPATNLLHISNGSGETLDMKVYTLSGQVLLSCLITAEADVNISTLPAGNYIYVLSAQGKDRKLYSASFTKQ